MKALRLLGIGLAALLFIPACHLGYLYTHCEFSPPDFKHKSLVLHTQPTTPPDAAHLQHVQEILSQKFHYLGRGRQMTAFESADHQYVIKFFNPRTFIKKKWFSDISRLRRMVSLKWLSRAYFKREARLKRLSHRHQIALDGMAEDAGLIYAHLNPGTALATHLTCEDKEGRLHDLPLEHVPFILQKKSNLIFSHLQELLQEGEIEKAQERVREVYALFESRAHKGFTDRIQTLHNNYGFTSDGAIQIDVGGIMRDPLIAKNPTSEIQRVFANITPSLLKRFPELHSVIQECNSKERF